VIYVRKPLNAGKIGVAVRVEVEKIKLAPKYLRGRGVFSQTPMTR
jgi:hypothetical protein